jgi:BirA family biotin operon repressor/biotin-[acetyl-CoA-carboxylase] ligase
MIQPTSVKREFKEEVNREKLLSEILNHFEEIYEQAKENPDKVINDWKSKCRLIGEKVKITEGDNIKSGVFSDIDPDGFMLLRTASGIEKIHFGDVSLR